ncbi:hypothetical protein X739_13640 [Mesorhizobium sp. LNHC220B00]|nr:hypothetical protein X739_13640 [Mesorhizobium sp. LNHC220B00]
MPAAVQGPRLTVSRPMVISPAVPSSQMIR